MIRLKHGIDKTSGGIVHVESVESGLNCNCKCVCCDSDLVARKGAINTHHFSHYNRDDCIHAGETAAHLIAKDIIQERGIFLPRSPALYDLELAIGITSICGSHIVFDSVMTEKRFHDFIPDVIGMKDGVEYIIEVAVTHRVDYKKSQKILKSGVCAVEIFLDSTIRDYDTDYLLNEVVKDARRNWIVEPKTKEHKFTNNYRVTVGKYANGRKGYRIDGVEKTNAEMDDFGDKIKLLFDEFEDWEKIPLAAWNI